MATIRSRLKERCSVEIINIPIKELKPYEKNAKIHTAEQIKQIVSSIEQFGMNDPIGIWGEDNIIVEGHGRLEALKKLKYKEVPCIRLDHLTEEQRKAYTLAHNKLTMNTDFDFELLDLELDSIVDIDMSDFGFDLSEDEEETEIVEDEAPEVDEENEPTAKFGDIWQLGRHRLMCGDSTDPEQVARLMNGVKADMTFCDPPYGYKYESNHQDKHEMLLNDDVILDFLHFRKQYSKADAHFYICCSWQTVEKWLNLVRLKDMQLKNIIVWKKNNWSMGDLKGAYAGQHELILFCNDERKELYGGRDRDIWEFDREPPKLHPTMKPVELVVKAINKSSKKDDIVVDLFGGSGTTLIACQQSDRISYTAELDPKYIDVIIKRYENLTGDTAVLLENIND